MILLSGPNIGGNEWKYIKDCLDTGWVSSVGAYVTQFEQMVAEFAGARFGVATSSGTTALHMALLLEEVQADDYVIVPNVTFVASVNSIRYVGARPILMDIDPLTWQMDLDLLADFLAEKTELRDGECCHRADGRRVRAIMPVHVLGNMADMERLMGLAAQYHLRVIEDATESLGSYFKGKHSGTFSRMGCFSFNGNKIITTGGGGMIVTDDEALARKAKHLTTQAKADSFEYYHDEVGYNYRLVNTSAAMGVAQMEQLPGFIERKHAIAAIYKEGLSGVGDIGFQEVAPEVEPNWWLFTIHTERQREVLERLNAHQMQSRPFWVPMNQLPMYREFPYIQTADHSDRVYRTALSIPCSTNITDGELEQIIGKIRECY
ncbi:MAG: LegC family aminotransferase [Saprospiraceae bacterium]|nr:LegC family aminotransferase [Saprospiraceae bacterium]MCB0680319.1 LegC family aminotransferase [Saprospiraceae bacterium]